MLTIFDYINNIKNTQGTNAKLDLLKEYSKDSVFQKVLFYAYNPFYNYYIRKIPKTNNQWSALGDYQSMFDLLDDLRTRKYTGNAAIEKVSNFIKHSPEHISNVFTLIVGRDLKMGINTTSINKIIPNLIPTFDVMLAESGIPLEKLLEENKWLYVQKKSDGKRCIAICKENSAEFYARSGKPIDNLAEHETLINSILCIRNTSLPFDFVLDGEVIIENDDGTDASRQYSNGLISKKDLSKQEVERFSYVVWDVISLYDFINNCNKIEYEDRYYSLINSIKSFKNIKVIPTFTATTKEKIEEITSNFIDNGFEGSIVKTPNHYYQRKRSKGWIKFKEIQEADLKVVGYKYGNAGTKYESMLGSLICESEDGVVKVDVGTGYSDDQRKEIKESILGSIITVRYNQIIQDINGNYSLYLPRFIEIREDKDVADTLSKIRKNG